MQNQVGYAWITGATGGVGSAFARILASRNQPLLLMGRNQEKLQNLQAQLQAEYPQLPIRCIVADLANDGDRYAAFEKIQQENLSISLLINVAGADVQKAFEKYTQEKLTMQCRVNFEAAASCCHFAMQRKSAHLDIINISSVSGIYPMPYFAIYSATKGALASFSVALREEVKGKNIHVTAVLPGAMPTREDIKEQIKGQGAWGKLAVKSPEWVAQKSLKAVAKNKAKIIPGFWNKVMRISTACLPMRWKLAFIAKRWSKIEKDAF